MKKYKGFILLLNCFLLLTACGRLTDARKSNDRIEVYDKDQNMIVEIVKQKELDYFSDLIGNTTMNMEDEDFPLVKLPKDADLIYQYKFITKREDGKETKVYFDVYKNYQYITVKGMPIVSPLTWKLSEEEYSKLKNPKSE